MSLRPLAALLDTLPVAFVAHDAQHHVILWNPAAEALLGWTRDEVLGKPSPLPPEVLARPVPSSRSTVPRVWLTTRDGAEREVAVANMPMLGHEASAQALWLPADDAHGLDLAALHALFDAAPDGAVVVDRRGLVEACNPALLRLLGAPKEAVVGHSIEAFLALPAGPARPFGGLAALEGAVLVRRPSGAPFTARVTVTPLGSARCAAFFRDVTGAATAELERRLFGRVFDTSSEAILITDAKNAILAVNPAFTRITGYALDEVLGKNPKLLSSGRQDRVFYEDLWAELRRAGSWRGEVWNRRKSGEVYCQLATISTIADDAGQVTNYVAVFADVTALKDAEAALTSLAQRDHLTGLPNRALLRDRLDQALRTAQRSQAQVALLVMDVDGFKRINGSLGVADGDALLKEVAQRLEDSVRAGDTVARLGSDEFALVLGELTDPAECHAVEGRLRAALAQPMMLGGEELRLTVSIGLALYPHDGDAPDALLARADSAMHAARDAGRNTTRFFAAGMNEHATERLHLVQALGRALERGELRVEYQPQRPVTGDALLGAEALLRWRHPELGAIGPDRFIPLAEETGLIRPIGLWVLEQAAQRAQAWRLPVSVNLSTVQLADAAFVEQVQQVLTAVGVDPSLLEFEVTESVVMKDPAAAVALLTRLKQLGMGLSMDDFGTGYSSLTQLKRLPLDRLKIDRAFVRDVLTDAADQAVVQAVIAMGHALKLRVIAEGVETAGQRALLASLGCDEVQGYLCGRPGPPELIEAELGR